MKKEKLLNTIKSFCVPAKFSGEREKKFEITMNNSYLNARGRIPKRQTLISSFTRKLTPGDVSGLFSTQYVFDQVAYSEKSDKHGEVSPINWTFMKEKDILFHIFSLNKKDLPPDSNRETWKENFTINQNLGTTYKTFSSFPRLPSVYLMIMQIMDIFGFETYLSYIHSIPELAAPGRPHLVTLMRSMMQGTKAPIDFGLYSKNSFFEDSDYYMTNMGISIQNEKPCILFEFRCDGAKVMMQDKNREDIKRSGSSYYSGYVFINVETGDIEKATMLESYVALQFAGKDSEERKVPIHIRRSISMTAL